jgi:RNase P subunit RPR2
MYRGISCLDGQFVMHTVLRRHDYCMNIQLLKNKEPTMIRIVCPHCHAPLSSAELEQATVDGHLSLICPECASVLVSDRERECHTLAEHFPDEVHAHA